MQDASVMEPRSVRRGTARLGGGGPVLLAAGLLLLLALNGVHFAHVAGMTAGTRVDRFAEIVRANMTPLAWCAYLVFLLGVLAVWDRRSWLARYRNRFLVCWLWSVPAWCYF